ncbi:MAG: hypothetical protein HC904_11175, partial [Blastochloris sp.]|nr:hypothetical protein [Blastochloris sp.]
LDHALSSAYLEQSYLGRAGKFIQPLFEPAGFDWKITVGVLASFPAREVIISTLGVIYHLGGDQDEASGDLREKLQRETWTQGPRRGTPIYSIPTAAAIMVFFALCMQCGATLAIMKTEAGWKWALASFVLMTSLAWVGAVSDLSTSPSMDSFMTDLIDNLLVFLIVAASLLALLRPFMGRRTSSCHSDCSCGKNLSKLMARHTPK